MLRSPRWQAVRSDRRSNFDLLPEDLRAVAQWQAGRFSGRGPLFVTPMTLQFRGLYSNRAAMGFSLPTAAFHEPICPQLWTFPLLLKSKNVTIGNI